MRHSQRMPSASSLKRGRGHAKRRPQLPLEVIKIIVRMACERAVGDADAPGACTRVARARLNLVSRELAAIACSVQWRHIELTETKDVGFFMTDLLPKYGAGCCKFTLSWRGNAPHPAWPCTGVLRGGKVALQALLDANPVLTPATVPSGYGFLFTLLLHALAAIGTVEFLRLVDHDWISDFSRVHALPGSHRLRRLELRSVNITGGPGLGRLLQGVSATLEDLRIVVDRYDGSPADVLCSWPAVPGKPRLPRLQILISHLKVMQAVLLDQAKVSEFLRYIRLEPVSGHEADLVQIAAKHGDSLATFIVDDRQRPWHWQVLRGRTAHLRPLVEQCASEYVAFRWEIRRSCQMGKDPEGPLCPADLVGKFDLV